MTWEKSPPKESPLGEVPFSEERSSDGNEMEVESGEEEGDRSERFGGQSVSGMERPENETWKCN